MSSGKILVVVDPRSEEQPAVDRAAWLARRLSADLELFICDYDPDIAMGRVSTVWIDKPAREHLLDVLRQKLESLAAPLREEGIEVAIDVVWDHPLQDGIVRKVDSSDPWLVVKDTHHHNVLKRTILTNTDWELIRNANAPLLLVKPRPVGATPKVFAAIDPLHTHAKPVELDDRIVDIAKELADGVGGELHVLHTFSAPVELIVPEETSINEFREEVSARHRQAFDEFTARLGLSDDRLHLVESPPHEGLLETVESEDAWLIVMGAMSRRGLDKLFIGSTAERILDRLVCDVLVVKPASDRT